jgi:hypothetical protein
MAKQNSNDSPPFATKDGHPKAPQAGGDSGKSGVDFSRTTNPQSAPVPGHDFNADHRPQSEARPEVYPSKGEIPAGGPVLMLDPDGKEKAGESGTITPVGGGPEPWKSLR